MTGAPDHDARSLIEGDRFEWDGSVHLVDDVPVTDGDLVIVPTRAGPDSTWVELPAGTRVTRHDRGPIDVDPVRFGVALSQLPPDHPLVAAAGLAVETVHTLYKLQGDHLDLLRDISGAQDWARYAARRLPYAELAARRGRPIPTDHPTKDDTMDDDTPATNQTNTPTVPSLPGLLETWQSWDINNMFVRAEAKARAAGNTAQANRLHDVVDPGAVRAVEALAAQHEVASMLAGWEWHTVRAAREQGASWTQIAKAHRHRPGAGPDCVPVEGRPARAGDGRY